MRATHLLVAFGNGVALWSGTLVVDTTNMRGANDELTN